MRQLSPSSETGALAQRHALDHSRVALIARNRHEATPRTPKPHSAGGFAKALIQPGEREAEALHAFLMGGAIHRKPEALSELRRLSQALSAVSRSSMIEDSRRWAVN